MADIQRDTKRAPIGRGRGGAGAIPILRHGTLCQLLRFQQAKERLGLVVDEYGDIPGSVTSEDILEIVGDFTTDPIPLLKFISQVVKTVNEGDVFGELALLYNCPRAASVVAKDAPGIEELNLPQLGASFLTHFLGVGFGFY